VRVLNKTDYPTRAIRSILCAVHSAEPRGRLKQWHQLSVEIVYARRTNWPYTGSAYINGTNAYLSVPRPGTEYANGVHTCLAVVKLAALWRHEMWHLYGFEHCDYGPALRNWEDECVDHVDLNRFGSSIWPPNTGKCNKIPL